MAVFRGSSGKPAKLGNGEVRDKSPVSRKRLASPHLLTSLISQRSELPIQSTAVKRPLICHRRNSIECVGSGRQVFPQCNPREGPHFPSKQDKKFKEAMGTVSLCEKWASCSVMLPQSLAHTRNHEGACFLQHSQYYPALQSGAEVPGHCSYPSSPRLHSPDPCVSLGKEPSSHRVNSLQREVLTKMTLLACLPSTQQDF